MASSSPSSTKRRYMYDVFLSFRGSDTRTNFTDHLYMALIRAGIQVFRDSEELRTGEVISEALIRAIQGSMYYIVILSENYASSSWCLDELVHIMERRKGRIFPIFHRVNPSYFRYMTGSFCEAIEIHEALKRRTQDEISGWRSALREVADLSGWNSSKFW
uniref:toll/interleukin-1 receptor-like protein n=1 Tax=Fragaria vesca subsp. vesca TaxID=101020 RepID=UPI0005C83BB4|nr:PREDICTED: toll/interleukin-1 receptor-like protein [Fragaria vesca subsp. vesca]